MTTAYRCPGCDSRVVLANSGGVWRTILCRECNCEMKYDSEHDDVETEWIGHRVDTHGGDDYKLVERGE